MMCSGGPKTLSLTRYHDEVLIRSLNLGLVDADEFDEMEFLMRGVGEDLVGRKIAPLEVKRQNEDFIKYSLYHAKGVEMVMEMLASEDTLRQQTAANMPGFWSSESEHMRKVGIDLLSRLGEKLGFPGKVAEGAANSFKSLAVAWCKENSSPLLRVYVSRSEGQRQSSGAGGGETTDAVSRSEGGMEGGGNMIHRSGGGRDGAGVGSGSGGTSSTGRVEKKEFMQRSSKSEAAEGEGSGVSELSQTVTAPEGEKGHSHSQVGVAGESISTAPESGNHMTSIPQGDGQRGASAGQSDFTSGGMWNVVQKVVDLVANKRLPTLQVYVRALDAFFMSKSIRESLTEKGKDRIKRKLRAIAEGSAGQGSGGVADRVSIGVDASTKAHTKLLAFSALERLGLDPNPKRNDEQILPLLQQLDKHLKQVRENSVIWIEEVRRYEELCQKYEKICTEHSFKPVKLRERKEWKIQGTDFF